MVKPRRRFWIPRVCLFGLAIFAGRGGLPAEPSGKVNLIFILADDLGWSDTTLFGTTRFYQTPNLERLARRGVAFTRAYSASPLCSSTRASILTGMHPACVGITAPNCHLPQVVLRPTVRPAAAHTEKTVAVESATRLDTRYVTLAERLKAAKAAGYATAFIG